MKEELKTLTRWINSCTKLYQLDNLLEFIKKKGYYPELNDILINKYRNICISH